MTDPCERLWEVDALREGRLSKADAVAHRRHAATCGVCRERFAADERLAVLGRALPEGDLDPLRARRLRNNVLRAAGGGPAKRPWIWLAPIAATFFAVVLAALTHRLASQPAPLASSPPPAAASSASSAKGDFAGRVTPMPGARWAQQRSGGAERVDLTDGTITLHVRKQTEGERFVVLVPDGEVEVRGTTFSVTVALGRTTAIEVEEGTVVFRGPGHLEVVLRRGDTWRAPERTRDDPASRSPAPPPSPRPSASPATSEYTAAVDAYGEHDYRDAAARFSAFVAAHPTAPEAEDASFLEASSLAHDGRTDAAAAAAERFLVRYPSSFHARDAAVLVARGARERGDCTGARRVLRPWLTSPTPEVVRALGACASD